MVCILRHECNFLNGYFRCLLPVETVDVEVKVKMMQGFHMFQRDRTSKIINCNCWSTKLHPYPSLIQKMKTYLELEGNLGPKPRPQLQTQPQPSTSSHSPKNNPTTRKVQGSKTNDKRRTVLAKRRYKVRIIAQPTPTIPTPTAPTPTVATTSTQTPVVRSTTASITVMVYNFTKEKFSEVSYPTGNPQENPSISNSNPPHHLKTYPRPQLEKVPLWPNKGSVSQNLFKARKDLPIPPTPALTLTVKTEAPPQVAVIPPCNAYAQTSCIKMYLGITLPHLQ